MTMKRRFLPLLLATAIIATFQFTSVTTASFLLVKIDEEGSGVVPELTPPPPQVKPGMNGVDYAPTDDSITNPQNSGSGACTIENKCAKVYDPDRKHAKMDEGFIGRGSRDWPNYRCCYRYWWNDYYYCNWGLYWCNIWG